MTATASTGKSLRPNPESSVPVPQRAGSPPMETLILTALVQAFTAKGAFLPSPYQTVFCASALQGTQRGSSLSTASPFRSYVEYLALPGVVFPTAQIFNVASPMLVKWPRPTHNPGQIVDLPTWFIPSRSLQPGSPTGSWFVESKSPMLLLKFPLSSAPGTALPAPRPPYLWL